MYASTEVICAAIVVAWIAILITLQVVAPYEATARLLRPGAWTDLWGYTVVQSLVMGWLIAELIRWVDALGGLSRLALVSTWPLPLQVAFFVVTHDLYIYWFHRCQHRHPLLWRLHEAHHSNTSLDWLASMRSHSAEIWINQTVEYAPIVLLGAAPEVAVLKGTISAVWGLWIHANVDIRTGWLQYLINGPEAHRWHHATDKDAYDTNFATKLAIWDWLFGTAFLPRGRRPEGYGLDDTAFPSGFFRQQLFAFRAFPSSRA